jgi:schlafen-like transcriptional regulator
MLDNGGPEPRFDITKITAFEVTSYSALEMLDNQGKMVTSEADFTKLFTKMFTKLVPEYFPTKEEKNLSVLIRHLVAPQKASELSVLLGITDRTLRNRYLTKMLQAGVVELTIPEKPTSRNQPYRLKQE